MTAGARYATFVKPGVRLLRETIVDIDPAARRVTTDAGVHVCDHLVVVLGADYDMAATLGLENANKFYSVAGADRLGFEHTGVAVVLSGAIADRAVLATPSRGVENARRYFRNSLPPGQT